MKTFLIILGIVLIVISGFWAYNDFGYEPVLVFLGSIGSFFGSYFISNKEKKEPPSNKNINTNEIKININTPDDETQSKSKPLEKEKLNKSDIYDLMKTKLNILFIDDDKKFKIVKILKDSGWRNTKTVEDLKSLDNELTRTTNIFFVDIHGVGKMLDCPAEGLDLAYMLKQKFPGKKVVIYSANNKNDIFHKAFKVIDFTLEKNALPYEFLSLVEEFSIEFYKN